MPRAYTYETTISFGGDTPTAELEVEFAFTVNWGCEAQTYGPAERCYPGEPDEVDDIRVVAVNGKPSGWSAFESDSAVADLLINALTDDDYARMIGEAAESDQADHDDAAEARWETRKEMGW